MSRASSPTGKEAEAARPPEKALTAAGRQPAPKTPADPGFAIAGMGQSAEIELKLDCDPERLDETARAVEPYRRGPERAFDLRAVYYDTRDLALLGSGSVLRVRSDGQRCVMTLKARKPPDGKVLERTEWTAPVAGMEPDLDALSKLLPPDLFAPIRGATLKPVFSTEVHRRTCLLETPLGMVELALDKGRIVAEGRAREISEIELELKAGRTEAILWLAEELVSNGELRPNVRSKSARGFDLALDRAPEAVRPRRIAFLRRVTLEDALDQILRMTMQHMMESQPAAEDGRNPEGLHQYRVALRRLRSALDLMRLVAPSSSRLQGFRADARRLMSELNDARDWDVFDLDTMPAVARACPSVEGFELLGKAAEGHRARAHERARSGIRDPRTGRFQIGLALWVEQKAWRGSASPRAAGRLSQPARAFAQEQIEALHRRVLKRGRRFGELSPRKRHKLRIAVKKLRYAADFLSPLFQKPKDESRFARSLSNLQDELGRSNDLSVVDRLVHRMTEERVPSSARFAAGAVLGWTAGHRARNDSDAVAAWKAFRKHGMR